MDPFAHVRQVLIERQAAAAKANEECDRAYEDLEKLKTYKLEEMKRRREEAKNNQNALLSVALSALEG